MTSPPVMSPVELQAEALVDEIGRKVGARQRELLDIAAREAEEIRERARVRSRRQMRRAVDEMRATERQRTQQVRAELETADRRRASALALEMLSAAWPQLAAAIEQCWHDPPARRRWMAAQLALACSRLPAAGWVLRHPGAWTDAERSVLRGLLRDHGVEDATLRPEPALTTGLVIEVAGARLDSTPQALLADRARVEAALLAALEPALVGRELAS